LIFEWLYSSSLFQQAEIIKPNMDQRINKIFRILYQTLGSGIHPIPFGTEFAPAKFVRIGMTFAPSSNNG
jgi:hypothetical protein